MDLLLGFVLGLAGSFLYWWVFSHIIVPKVEFSPTILRRPGKRDPNIPRYLIKFWNRGRRKIIDISIVATVSIQTKPQSDSSWSISRLAFHRDGFLDHSIAMLPPGANRLIVVLPSYSDRITFDGNFSEDVRNAVLNRNLDLLSLLNDGNDRNLVVRVRVHLFGYDSFSGARKLFSSKFYTAADVEQ